MSQLNDCAMAQAEIGHIAANFRFFRGIISVRWRAVHVTSKCGEDSSSLATKKNFRRAHKRVQAEKHCFPVRFVSRRSRPAPALRTDGCPTERKVLRFRRCKAVASVGPRNCGQLSSSPSKYCRTQMRLCGEGRVSAPGRI
jgi:hypothetical protein